MGVGSAALRRGPASARLPAAAASWLASPATHLALASLPAGIGGWQGLPPRPGRLRLYSEAAAGRRRGRPCAAAVRWDRAQPPPCRLLLPAACLRVCARRPSACMRAGVRACCRPANLRQGGPPDGRRGAAAALPPAGRGLAYEGVGDWVAALHDYEAALSTAAAAGMLPDPYIQNSLGNCHASLGAWEQETMAAARAVMVDGWCRKIKLCVSPQLKCDFVPALLTGSCTVAARSQHSSPLPAPRRCPRRRVAAGSRQLPGQRRRLWCSGGLPPRPQHHSQAGWPGVCAVERGPHAGAAGG